MLSREQYSDPWEAERLRAWSLPEDDPYREAGMDRAERALCWLSSPDREQGEIGEHFPEAPEGSAPSTGERAVRSFLLDLRKAGFLKESGSGRYEVGT